MKKLILIAICFVSLQLSAQGNLQFNQVVNLNYTHTIPSGFSNSTVTNITVPAGKIWKIEYSSLSRNNASYRFTGVLAQSLSIDNFVLIAQNSNGNFERQKGFSIKKRDDLNWAQSNWLEKKQKLYTHFILRRKSNWKKTRQPKRKKILRFFQKTEHICGGASFESSHGRSRSRQHGRYSIFSLLIGK